MQSIIADSESEVCDVVRDAVERRSAIEIVGHGSKRSLGRPISAETMLDTSRLSGVMTYEPDEMVLTARAATPLPEIEPVLAAQRQMLAFEPADWGPLYGCNSGATLAGVVGASASGARRARAGNVRDHLIGCRFVNGSGEAVRAGGRVVKNVTGFDITKLVCGAFGTLGVLTELTFRTVPAPETTGALALRNCPPAEGLQALRRAAALPVEATGLTYLPGWISQPLGYGDGMALIRVEGSRPAVADKLQTLARLFSGHDCVTVDGDSSAALFRRAGNGAWFDGTTNALWRVFPAPSESFAAVKLSGASKWYADWAGGAIWAELPATDETVQRMREVVRHCGGTVQLMRADEAARTRLPLFLPQEPVRQTLTAAVKRAFDPQRVLNPGRMFEDI